MANYITRYGYSGEVDEVSLAKIAADLIEELRSEEYEEPDDEHTQVSIGNEHWSITAQVSGLITFDNIDMLEGNPTDLPETMFMRDIDDHKLISLWQVLLADDKNKLLSFDWVQFDELPNYVADFYRKKA